MALDRIVKVLQIQPIGVPETVRLSQNENGRTLIFHLVGNEEAIPDSSTVTISGTKPDGVVYSAVGSISSDVVTFTEDTQMTAAAGVWDAKIQITKDGETVATARIRFVIDADPVAPGSVPSESELDGLVAQAQNYATIARGAAYGSPLTASTVSAMTDHERVYVYTGSETGYTSGNWYYWNGSAWTSGGIYNSEGIETDTTLTVAGMAADAKTAGDAIRAIIPGLSDVAKAALLECFRNVAWINWTDGQTSYYEKLVAALDYVPPTPEPFDYGVYEPEEVVNGKYIDGSGDIQDGTLNQSFYIADYIPVVASSYWIGYQPPVLRSDTSSIWSESNWRISEYSQDKTFIKQTQYSSGSASGADSSVVHAFDSNTRYIRLGWYDPYGGGANHAFDIEDPTTLTALPMESGDVNATTGQNAVENKRIRTVGFIPASGSTMTFSTCPFAPTWSDLNNYSIFAVRCYDSSYNYLGNLTTPNPTPTSWTASLLTSTAYVRLIMQAGANYNFSMFAKMVAYLYEIDGISYRITGV